MDIHGAGVDDLRSLPEQLVDDPGHRPLVAGNGGGGQDHPVPRADLHLPVLGEGHPVQGGHVLPLAAGGDDDGLGGGQGVELVHVHQHAVGDIHIPLLRRHPDHVLHAAAGDAHLPLIAPGAVDDLLDAVDVGGEGGDDNPLVTAPEQGVHALPHMPLRVGIARPLHIGGVRQQRQNPLLAQLGEAGEVEDAALDGGQVDLEVAGVDDLAHGGAHRHRHAVRDGVVHMDEFQLEHPHLEHVPGVVGDDFDLLRQAVLLQLEAHKARRQTGGVDGAVQLAHHVGHAADVVLVAMGQDDALHPLLVFDEVGDVRDDHVDAVHVLVREAHAAVHHEDVLAVLIDVQVFADLVETAKRQDFQF